MVEGMNGGAEEWSIGMMEGRNRAKVIRCPFIKNQGTERPHYDERFFDKG
jgi:hypothetical protein